MRDLTRKSLNGRLVTRWRTSVREHGMSCGRLVDLNGEENCSLFSLRYTDVTTKKVLEMATYAIREMGSRNSVDVRCFDLSGHGTDVRVAAPLANLLDLRAILFFCDSQLLAFFFIFF